MAVEKTPEEQLAAAEAEADAAFQSGFKKVDDDPDNSTPASGADKDEIEPTVDKDSDDDATSDDDDDPPAKEIPIDPRLQKQFRDMNGQLGGLKQQIATLTETLQKSATAKDESEEDKANPNLEEMDMTEFSELTPIRDELVKTKEKLAALELKQAKDLETAQSRTITSAHSDWQTTVATKEFLTYALEDGPPEEAYHEMRGLITAARQSRDKGSEDQALESRIDGDLKVWQETYPEWWKDRGQHIYTAEASGLIKLLDGFKPNSSDDGSDADTDVAHPSAEEKAAAAKANAAEEAEKRKKRLRGNRRPKGVSGTSESTLISDDGAFNKGFDKVAKSH